ncbi:unnamed protein product [Haemonchus placei]|uniref:Peptidase_M13_N domain-containing protein n=1 Tax=Haemonchus placei TaxID=6290 RepID=A0A0N4WZQ5_HAEPC|nr:unnamed protein product [Haemonchus placei]
MWLLPVLLSLSCFGDARASKDEDGLPKNASNTPGYALASEMLLKSINFSVDPCMDFFEFTCGNWVVANPIPNHESSYTQLEKLSDKVQEQMRGLFESSEMFPSRSMNALKLIYQKCMDKKELNKIGSRRLLQTIGSYGVWPMIEGDDKFRVEDFDLTSLMIHLTKVRELHVFVANYPYFDSKNVSRRLIHFDQANLGLGESTRDYYLDQVKYDKKIEAYRQLLIDVIKLINEYDDRPNKNEKIAQDVDEIIDFETKIAKIMVADEDRRDNFRSYNLRHLSDMQNLMPMIDWSRYFYSILPHSVHKYIANDPNVVIIEIDYMRRITELLRSTDPRVITNYVFTRFTSLWEEELGERFDDVLQV